MHSLGVIQRINAEAITEVTLEIKMTQAQYDTVREIYGVYSPRLTRDEVSGSIYALHTVDATIVRDYCIEPDGSYTYEELTQGYGWDKYGQDDELIW